jgi:hypothetical protein
MADLNPNMAPTPDSPRVMAGRTTDDPAYTPPANAREIEDALFREVVIDYRPRTVWSANSEQENPFIIFQDIEAMRRDDVVSLPLSWIISPLSQCEWEIEASSPPVAKFVEQQMNWFWTDAVWEVTREGYPYGWCAGEMGYTEERGLLVQGKFDTFSARDVSPLFYKGKPVGVQVNHVNPGSESNGLTRLWGFRKDVPSKAFWYAHQARHGNWFGESQIRGAWRPWRRLAGRDGAEEISDMALYRYGVGYLVARYPASETKVSAGSKNTDGSGLMSGRDAMRQVAANLKYGGGVHLPSIRDAHGNYLYTLDVETPQLNIEAIDNKCIRLEKKISKAIGVPPELFEAAETGSGWSGRAVPWFGFLVARQPDADRMTRAWANQIGTPLVRWNFGPNAWFKITAKRLTESHGAPPPGGEAMTKPTGGQLPPQKPPQAPPAPDEDDEDDNPEEENTPSPKSGDDLLKDLNDREKQSVQNLATELPHMTLEQLEELRESLLATVE